MRRQHVKQPSDWAFINALNRYIGTWRQSMTDALGSSVDLSHMCVTTLGYLSELAIPDAWTGWAGDLASTMSNIQMVMDWNPDADINAVSDALVGQGDDYRSHPGLANLTIGKYVNGTWTIIGNTCNYDDLCCDGDAIYFAHKLSSENGTETHLLSQTLRTYYNDFDALSHRFKQIAWSMGATNQTDATKAFRNEIDWANGFLRWMLNHYTNIREEVINAACAALARFIF